MGKKNKNTSGLKGYQISFKASMELFELTHRFPEEETHSLTDQIRRSSRSISSNQERGEKENIQKHLFLN